MFGHFFLLHGLFECEVVVVSVGMEHLMFDA